MNPEAPAIIVTGASRGLGKAIARQLDTLGCRCLLVSRSQEPLQELAAELARAEIMVADLADPDCCTAVVQHAVSRFGRLDGLVNNAGTIAPIKPLSYADHEAWARAITVNLTSPALLMAAALPELEKTEGRVVNISTGAAVGAVQGWSAYCASKAGLLHLNTVVARENPKVGCFSLRPGVIDTQMQAEIRGSDGMTPDDLEKFKNRKNEGQLEPPEVPARSAVWLVLRGPLARSGEYITYTDSEVVQGAEELFRVHQ